MRSIYLMQQQVALQVEHYRKSCNPSTPEWYETRRKTTHVIFWS